MNLVLIILLSIIGGFIGLLMLMKFMMSPSFPNVMMFLFIFASVVLVYYFLGNFIFGFFKSIIGYNWRGNKNMDFWDNIWYLILIVFIMLILAVFIKSIKDNGMRWNLLLSAIAVLFILFLYTVLYFVILYNDKLGYATFILTIIIAIYTAIIMLIRGWSMKFTAPIFSIYAMLTIVYGICLFVLVFNMLLKCYDYIY